MELKKIQIILVAICIMNIFISTMAMPTANNNDDPVTIKDEMTPYPFTQKRYVDLSYVSPEVSNMIQKSNLNIEQIRQQQDRLRNRYEVITSSTAQPEVLSENEEDYRIAKIQSELQATLRDPVAEQGIGRERAPSPSFEYAFPAVCEMPKSMNYSDWFGQKSWNIIFKPIYRHFNVQSSILRIFKISKEEYKSSSSTECNEDVTELFTLKVSVYARKKSKEFIKKAIHESLIPSKRVGWIEVDVISTLKFWNNPKNNYGLSIDMYDEQGKQLDAREYFELQNCADEAAPVLPWGAFQFLAEQSSPNKPVSTSVLEQFRQMYPQPRLDIMSLTPANYNAQYSSSEEDQSRRNINRTQRHIRHNHHSLVNEHRASIDNLISSLKSKSHKRRGHISRDDNGTAGDT
ncbi:hypothetical protein PVAND_008968 [Polypedilum vanderplanki]|uniref:TGF-beta propeptide domain-containing protein n=1 Tax=Polypedilum vanderplanki TaxID=319348 RepID=A0A9J6CC13_POLVA|nr:hypothetical protein PVAND_008968 [Polypedilum vanderplanki]